MPKDSPPRDGAHSTSAARSRATFSSSLMWPKNSTRAPLTSTGSRSPVTQIVTSLPSRGAESKSTRRPFRGSSRPRKSTVGPVVGDAFTDSRLVRSIPLKRTVESIPQVSLSVVAAASDTAMASSIFRTSRRNATPANEESASMPLR